MRLADLTSAAISVCVRGITKMVITVKRDSGIFEPAVADELNKSFYKINKEIEDYNPPELAYKEDLQYITANSNSFRSGNLVCLREAFTVKDGHSQFGKVADIAIKVPYNYWCTAVTKEKENLFVLVKDTSIYVYGHLTHYPQEAYLVEDIVVP